MTGQQANGLVRTDLFLKENRNYKKLKRADSAEDTSLSVHYHCYFYVKSGPLRLAREVAGPLLDTRHRTGLRKDRAELSSPSAEAVDQRQSGITPESVEWVWGVPFGREKVPLLLCDSSSALHICAGPGGGSSLHCPVWISMELPCLCLWTQTSLCSGSISIKTWSSRWDLESGVTAKVGQG